MRRAIQQGRAIGIESPFMDKFAERALDLLAPAYPELAAQRDTVLRWVRDEEEGFGRTLERGSELLAELVEESKAVGTSWIDAADAFKLHDTYGFPYDLTKELLADEGLSVDDQGFRELMDEQRERARMGTATAHGSEDEHDAVLAFASGAPPSRFVGYEKLDSETSLIAVEADDGRVLAKLEESPFYAEGGGQVADTGVVRWNGSEAAVEDVYRVGDDQVASLAPGSSASRPGPGLAELKAGQQVVAQVDHVARHATMRNHTATHLLHAALREVLGTHVHQAGSSVRPDKLRFDFTHGAPLSTEEMRAVDDRVNEWIKESHPVRAIEMAHDDAVELGAMALFGEKYGEWVRMVEVEGVSRELCGGTHVANTAEIGIFAISSEGSSAANVRRIEALSGPAGIDWFRHRSRQLSEVGTALGSEQDPAAGAQRAAERLAELEKTAREAGAAGAKEKVAELAAGAEEIGAGRVVVARLDELDPKQLQEASQQMKSVLGGGGAIVLGSADGDSVALVASFGPEAIDAGLTAGEVVGEAARVVGGGGGGRDDFARAGGKDAGKLDEALKAARSAIEAKLGNS
jgi:alanyl-tRNA synthetase